MTSPFQKTPRTLLWLSCLLVLAGCGPKSAETKTPAAPHQEGHEHAHGSEETGAKFEEGKGILLSEETIKAIGLEWTEATEHALGRIVPLAGQVYRMAGEHARRRGGEQSGFAYATAMAPSETVQNLPPTAVALLSQGEKDLQGEVWKQIGPPLSPPGQTEMLVRFPDPEQKWKVGDSVHMRIVTGEKKHVLGIPSSAVLATAMGTYTFVRNGRHFLRTEIKTGLKTGEFVEVTEGIYEGDEVAVKPVETLYMIELRAVKGGGHCH
jgi:hypothetical protein